MNTFASSLRRSGMLLSALAFLSMLFALNLSFLSNGTVSANQLESRKMSMTTTAPSATGVSHTFTFTAKTNSSINEIRFQYCDNSIGTCNVTGTMDDLDVSAAAVTAQTVDGGAPSATFTAGGTGQNTNTIVLTSSGTTINDTQVVAITLNGIDNPEENPGFFVRITTYTGSSVQVDYGTVASATVDPVTVTAKVKERLGFSVTADDNDEVAGPNAENTSCDALTGSGAITLGDATEGVLDFQTPYYNRTYFRLYTNSTIGTAVQYSGNSLTKGTDIIDAIGASATASAAGSEQFGLAYDDDPTMTSTTGIVDTDIPISPTVTPGRLTIETAYAEGNDTDNKFAFVAGSTPQQIASSQGYVGCDTAAIRYVGNISPNTPAGVYTTTITYYAVPTF